MNLRLSSECYQATNRWEYKMIQSVGEMSRKNTFSHVCARVSGPLVSVASIALCVIGSIGNIFEKIGKGSANLFGSPFSEKCNFARGFKQIIGIPFQIIGDVATIALLIIISIPQAICMLAAPLVAVNILSQPLEIFAEWRDEAPGDFFSIDYARVCSGAPVI